MCGFLVQAISPPLCGVRQRTGYLGSPTDRVGQIFHIFGNIGPFFRLQICDQSGCLTSENEASQMGGIGAPGGTVAALETSKAAFWSNELDS